MVNKILAHIGGKRIRRLEIHGHGSPGNQSIGAGKKVDPTGKKELSLNGQNQLAGTAAQELNRLAQRLAPDAVVFLGGCEVGKGEKGQRLLWAVSQALGDVTVEASLNRTHLFSQDGGAVLRVEGAYHRQKK